MLFACNEIFHGGAERVERPDVEGSEGSGKRKNDEEDQRTSVFGVYCQARDRINDSEDEVGYC